jgi:hypothetical protein
MVVVRCKDIWRPRKVLVVEPAEPLRDLSDAEGVLVCSVDSGIKRGDSRVVVHTRKGHLDDAPHCVGDVADIEDEDGARLRVKVLGRTGPTWDVEITFTPAPQG